MEIIPTRPITYKGQNTINLIALGHRYFGRRVAGDSSGLVAAVPADYLDFAGFRRAVDYPHRRGRHAHRHRAFELLRRAIGRGHGLCAQQQAADRRRRPGRLVRPDPLDHHVQGHEPLVRQRTVRGLWPGPGRLGRGRRAHCQERHGRGRRPDHESRKVGGHHPRLRHGRGPGPAPGARIVRCPDQGRGRCQVRRASGRRAACPAT